jgi:hypothetical protein
VTIKLDEVVDVDGEGEEEVDTTEAEEEEEGSEEDAEEMDGYAEIGSDEDDSSSWFESASPTPVVTAPRSKKRSCDEFDAVDGNDSAEEGKTCPYPGRGGTPPKRARTESEVELLIPKHGGRVASSVSPRRMRKRSSEELEDRDAREELTSKRVKVALSVSEGDGTESPPPTSDSSLPSSTSAEDSEGVTMKRISRPDLERFMF